MKHVFIIAGLLAQLAFASVAFIWIMAFLGFTDESKRGIKATPFGKLIVTICLVLAFVPVAFTLWVGWCYYFSNEYFEQTPLGLWLPLVAILISLPVCGGLIHLFKLIGYQNRR